MCNKGGYMPTSQNKEDKELIHKRCNCYTTHGSLNCSHWLTQIYNGCHWVQNSILLSFSL